MITVRLGKKLTPEDFAILAPAGKGLVRARVIGVLENQAPTKALTMEMEPTDALWKLIRLATSARLHWWNAIAEQAESVNALVSGFGYRGKMAIASTIAHDSHHMIVVGTARREMALAANRLGRGQGRNCSVDER